MSYFQVNVSITDINDKGKQSKVTEQYLVDAVSVTDEVEVLTSKLKVLKKLKSYK